MIKQMSHFRKKYFSGLGGITFITAGVLLTIALLAFFSYNKFSGDFLSSEIGLKTGKTEASALPLLAKILPRSKPAASRAQDGINFDIDKPTVSSETSLAPAGEDFFVSQTNKSDEETEAGPLKKLVISEVLFSTKDSAKEEFVELFNPNDFAVNLFEWELRKKTENGNDSVLVSRAKFSGKVQPKDYFLVSHPDFSGKFDAELAWSSKSYSISENNAIYLSDNFGRQIDLVGCGSAFDYEAAACSVPETGVSTSRPNNVDTDNNQKDFSFSKPTPKQSFVAYISVLPPSQQVSPAPPQPSPTPSLPAGGPSPSPQLSPTPNPGSGVSILPTPSPEILPLQITAVQFGLPDYTHADFVEMFNPNSFVLGLKGYKLVKKVASSGNEDNLNYEWTETNFASANSNFYWVSSRYPEKIDELRNQGFTVFERDKTITETNGIGLRHNGELIASFNW